MAVQTDGSRFGAGARETLKRGASSVGVFGSVVRDRTQELAIPVAGTLAELGALSRRLRLQDLLTFGPLIRFCTRTLQARFMLANMIGLAILLGGIFYLSQSQAWLIAATRESLRAQGEIIAAAIAAN